MLPLYLVVGPSGSGKDTIVDRVCKATNKHKLKSYTTRPKRNKQDDTHIFVDELTFNALDIVARTKYDNNYYGATQEQIDNADFYIIDINGIQYFQTHNRTPRIIKTIYINVPEHIREQRITNRDDKTYAKNRIQNDKKAFKPKTNNYSLIINNTGTIEDAVNKIIKFMKEVEDNEH